MIDDLTISEFITKLNKEMDVAMHPQFNVPIIVGNDEIAYAISVNLLTETLGENPSMKIMKLSNTLKKFMEDNGLEYIRTDKEVWYGKINYCDEKKNHILYNILFDYQPIKDEMERRGKVADRLKKSKEIKEKFSKIKGEEVNGSEWNLNQYVQDADYFKDYVNIYFIHKFFMNSETIKQILEEFKDDEAIIEANDDGRLLLTIIYKQ